MSEATPNFDGRVNPAALTISVAAQMLSAAGGQRVTAEMLEADIATGAPANADGTINLMRYAAWLVREAVERGD